MNTAVVSGRITADVSSKLDLLAERFEWSRGWIVAKAVAHYVEAELKFQDSLDEAERQIERGETYTREENGGLGCPPATRRSGSVIAISYAALARRALEPIHRYHREIDPDLAATLLERIVAATRLLREWPHAGSETLRGQRRKWRVTGTRHIIFYRLTLDERRILRVVHGARGAAAP